MPYGDGSPVYNPDTLPQPQQGDQFGFAVALEGEWLVVGVPGGDVDHHNEGRAHVYRKGV